MPLRPHHLDVLREHVRNRTVKVASPYASITRTFGPDSPAARRVRTMVESLRRPKSKETADPLGTLDKITHAAGMLSVPAGVLGYGYYKLTQPPLPNQPLY